MSNKKLSENCGRYIRMAMPSQLSPVEAKKKILDILHNKGEVIPTYHSKGRGSLRNVSLLDIINVLETGEIKRIPEWDEEHQNWVCNVEGFDLDEDKLIVVTAIIERDCQLIIITVKG